MCVTGCCFCEGGVLETACNNCCCQLIIPELNGTVDVHLLVQGHVAKETGRVAHPVFSRGY